MPPLRPQALNNCDKKHKLGGGAHTEAFTPRFGAVYRELLIDFYDAALAM